MGKEANTTCRSAKCSRIGRAGRLAEIKCLRINKAVWRFAKRLYIDRAARFTKHLRINTVAWCVLALIWWGLCYPELYFTENTYQPVMIVDGREVPVQEDMLEGLLRAEADEILVRSKLVEWWNDNKECILRFIR